MHFEPVAALTALASTDDPTQARLAMRAARAALGADAERFAPLMELMCQRVSELEQLRHLAGSDELTQAANRRAFQSALDREAARFTRGGEGFAVLLLDLDGLKEINDTLGHAAGDEAIIEAMAAIRDAVRATDLPARLGGDEMAVLLPETDLDGVLAVVARIRRLVESRRVGGRRLAISIGYAVADRMMSGCELLAQADRLLYEDKFERKAARHRAAA